MALHYKEAIEMTGRIIDNWLPIRMQYGHIPGMSVGIIHKGKLVYAKGFGFADVERKIPATARTRYRVASISKFFTTIALLQLAKEKKISFDDPVAKHLPKEKARWLSTITISDIASHTAGILRDGTTPHWVDDNFPDAQQLWGDVAAVKATLPQRRRFKYSNFGFALLGQVIEHASGKSYEAYMRSIIMPMLKIAESATDYHDGDELATGYGRRFAGVDKQDIMPHATTNAYASATGWISHVPDLAKALMNVPKDFTRIMTKKRNRIGGNEGWYGYGTDLFRLHKRLLAGHSGGFAGFISYAAMDYKNEIGIVVLANSIAAPSVTIARGIMDAIYRLVDKPPKGKKIANGNQYEGVYRSRWGDNIVVNLGSYLAAFSAIADTPLKDHDRLQQKGMGFVLDTKFGYDHVGERIHFEKDKKTQRVKTIIWGVNPYERIF